MTAKPYIQSSKHRKAGVLVVPDVFIHWGPRTVEQRRQVAKDVTDSILRNSGNLVKPQEIVVIFVEHQGDHVAMGGKLLSD